jgi:hypothetical protein
MVAEGKTAQEISERLAALVYVLQDWREQQIEMPNSKTPWDWDQADLEPYILRRTFRGFHNGMNGTVIAVAGQVG